jgi:hypothetical protein
MEQGQEMTVEELEEEIDYLEEELERFIKENNRLILVTFVLGFFLIISSFLVVFYMTR